MITLGPRKSIDLIASHDADHALRKTLSWPHLIGLGVGAIVGTGIYTLIGVGAGLAGPGVLLSFVISGLVCICAALAYAEMATMMPAAGSAYTYSYAVIGERVAWIVGWSLILEYTVVCAAVAVGWSGHVAALIPADLAEHYHWLLAGPAAGGLINLPAVLICFLVAGLLIRGTKESATLNILLVLIKLTALATFVVLAAQAFNLDNFHPFLPQGFAGQETGGAKVGVMAAAAIIFFAFYGFDAISTAAEETIRPERDLTIGIVGSIVLCMVIYMGVAAAALGAVPGADFSKSDAPLVFILETLQHPVAARLVAAAAVVALPTVILAFLYGQSRIFFVMARDGLLPERLGRVSQRSGNPVTMTMITASLAAIIAGLLPLDDIAALANAGTLCAFVAVSACMMLLRHREPERKRIFRTPLWWLTGPFAILGCFYLFFSLPLATILRFILWNIVGVVIYEFIARRSARSVSSAAKTART